MSFDINCYFLLGQRSVDSSIYGDISESFSKSQILNLISSGLQVTLSNTSIINHIPSPGYTFNNKKYSFVVGIPNKNGNNYSQNQIYTLMSLYNIPALLSITPYIKQQGNDLGEGSIVKCIPPSLKKEQWKKQHTQNNPGYVTRLPSSTRFSLYTNNKFDKKICFNNL
tara:strand:+ start:5689 stop:6192 length:504 start_codon:yes stop_codon:yes gene_type:complete